MRILYYVLVEVVLKHHTKIIQNIPIDCIQTTSMFFERVLSLYRNITSYILCHIFINLKKIATTTTFHCFMSTILELIQF